MYGSNIQVFDLWFICQCHGFSTYLVTVGILFQLNLWLVVVHRTDLFGTELQRDNLNGDVQRKLATLTEREINKEHNI